MMTKISLGFVVNRNELENPESLTFGEEEHKLGIRASSLVRFSTMMKVPCRMSLGRKTMVFKIASSLNVVRIKLAAACLDAQEEFSTFLVIQTKETVQHSYFYFQAIRKN